MARGEEYMERLTVTALRKRLYQVVDQVLETGVPVEVERAGKTVVIAPGEGAASRLARLERRNGIVSDPDELVKIKVGEWHELKNLD
jgi:antitoxin (DNA-binding transcriptional repressor) of toxin-antitoxin stability system